MLYDSCAVQILTAPVKTGNRSTCQLLNPGYPSALSTQILDSSLICDAPVQLYGLCHMLCDILQETSLQRQSLAQPAQHRPRAAA